MKMMKISLAVSFFLVGTASVAFAFDPALKPEEAWNNRNAPTQLKANYEVRFDKLPLSARLTGHRIPWSETYWPNNLGGISYRWNSDNPMNFKYKPPTKAAALTMSQEQLAELSPAEKYDLFLGNYKYPTVERVRKMTSPRHDSWYGICHGWAPASLLYSEPAPVVMINPDGIKVPFGSSDVKALLSFYYAHEADTETSQLGARCSVNLDVFKFLRNTDNCKDVNAGSFHIVVANQLGLMQTGFLMDRDRGNQVWNHPVFSYKSEIKGSSGRKDDSAKGTVRRVLIETTVGIASDDTEPFWDPILGTSKFVQEDQFYSYWLELDASGTIIGGEWTSWERPDFLWTKEKGEFEGYFSGLSAIYRSAH